MLLKAKPSPNENYQNRIIGSLKERANSYAGSKRKKIQDTNDAHGYRTQKRPPHPVRTEGPLVNQLGSDLNPQ